MSVKVGGGAESGSSSKPARGRHAHVEGLDNLASGDYSHAEGTGNTASGTAAHAEGSGNVASANYTHVSGISSTASASGAHACGSTCTASGQDSRAEGSNAVASRNGQYARSSGAFAVNGDAQFGHSMCRQSTTSATPVTLTSDGSATITLTGFGTNVLTLPASRAFWFRVEAVARRTDAQGEMAAFVIEGLVGRDSTGSARIIGTPTTASWADSGAAAWTLVATVNTTDSTNNYLQLTATGAAAKTIRWLAQVRVAEVAG